MKKPDYYLPPNLEKLRRGGPAIVLPKDAGLVIAQCGLTKNSTVLELGSGSGFMTAQLASIVEKVKTYEKREEFHKLSMENAEKLNLTNIEFVLKDVFDGLDEKENEYDLVFADIPDIDKISSKAYSFLKKNGYLVGYCLQSEQAKKLHLEAEKQFKEVFTIESMNREYDVKEYGFRPKNFGLIYTAYLVFARK